MSRIGRFNESLWKAFQILTFAMVGGLVIGMHAILVDIDPVAAEALNDMVRAGTYGFAGFVLVGVLDAFQEEIVELGTKLRGLAGATNE